MPEPVLTRAALNRALLARQMLLGRENSSPVQVIERLVGLQAQQPRPPFVGLWTRIAGFQREQLLKGLHARQIVRATLMRATLHLMSARDYLQFRASLQPVLSAGMRSVLGDRVHGFDLPAMLAAAHECFQEQPRTFTELRAALMAVYPDADERAMGYTVRTHLPLVIAPDQSEWGFPADPRFTLAEPWLGKPPEAGEHTPALVLRYLAAFGPATATDVQAWSGLTKLQAILDGLRPQLHVFRDERKRTLFDLPDAPRPAEDTPAPVRFVPAFDNLILSHTDRSRIIADEHRPRVVTRNLLVLPTFLIDGFVAGTWAIARQKGVATLTISPFAAVAKSARKVLIEEGEGLVRFVEWEAKQFEVLFEAQ